MLYVASVLLCLMSSVVLCDEEEIVYPDLPASSDLRLIYWNGKEDCAHKVNNMLRNVTAFCEGGDSEADPGILSCKDITSNLMKVLHSEQYQSRNCRVQFDIAKSLLDRFMQMLSQFKDELRGMHGIALRYQTNTTSLNDLLNFNHQQFLTDIDVMIHDIQNWKQEAMNVSKWDASYRHLDECDKNLKMCKEEFVAKMNDLTLCRNHVNELENAAGTGIRSLRMELNATIQKLDNCQADNERLNTRLEEQLRENKQWNDTSIFFIEKYNSCVEILQKEEEKNKELEAELKLLMQRLETYDSSLDVETAKKETCYREMANLQHDATTLTKLLQSKLTSLRNIGNNTNVLVRNIVTSHKTIDSVVRDVIDVMLSKTEQLRNCGSEKLRLDLSLTNCMRETENSKLESDKRVRELRNDLSSCNSEKKRLQYDYNSLEEEIQSTKTKLQKGMNNLNTEKEELETQNRYLKEEIDNLQKKLKEKEENIKNLENDKRKLTEELKTIHETLNNFGKEKKDMFEQLHSKNESFRTCVEQLKESREKYVNYTIKCQEDERRTLQLNKQREESLQEELNSFKQENANLKSEKHLLEIQKQNLRNEVDALNNKITKESTESQNCLKEKRHLNETIMSKQTDIEYLERQNEYFKSEKHLLEKQKQNLAKEVDALNTKLAKEATASQNCLKEKRHLNETIVLQQSNIKDLERQNEYFNSEKILLENQKENLAKEVDALNTKLAKESTTSQNCVKEHRHLNETIALQQSNIKDLERQNEYLKSEKHLLENQKQNLAKEVATLNTELTKESTASQNCLEEKRHLNETTVLQQSNIKDLERQNEYFKSEKLLLEKQKQNLANDVDALNIKLTKESTASQNCLKDKRHLNVTIVLQQSNIKDLERQIEYFKSEKLFMEKQKQSLAKEVDALDTKLTKESANCLKEKHDLNETIVLQQSNIKDLERQIEFLDAEKRSLEMQKQNLAQEVDSLNIKIINKYNATQKCLEEKRQLNQTITLKERDIGDLQRQNAFLNTEKVSLEIQKQNLAEEINLLNTKVINKYNASQKCLEEKRHLNLTISLKERDNEDLQRQNTYLKNEKHALEMHIQNFAKEINELNIKAMNKSNDLQKCLEEKHHLNQTIALKERDIDDLKKQNAYLTTGKNTLELQKHKLAKEMEELNVRLTKESAALQNCVEEKRHLNETTFLQQKSIGDLERQNAYLNSEKLILESQKRNLAKEMEELNDRLKRESTALQNCIQEKGHLNETTFLQQRSIGDLERENAYLKSEKLSLETQKENLAKEMDELNVKLAEEFTASQNCLKDKRHLNETVELKQRNIEYLEKQLARSKSEKLLLEIQKQNLAKEVDALNIKVINESNELQNCLEENRHLNQTTVLKERSIEDLQRQNAHLNREKISLEIQNQNLAKEKDELSIKLTKETTAAQNCIKGKLNMTEIMVLKDSYIEDLERQNANMNLTSKLTHIKLTTRINDLELKLRYLDHLLKSNRNELKMLQEYGAILIMLVNKNADILSFLKETITIEGEGDTNVMDYRLEVLLRKLVRAVEEHHSRIYAQMLQMKPFMEKVVPLRVRRQVQRGRTPDVALLGAAHDGNVTETGIMLDVGANVNAQDSKGLTALHWAARQGHAEVAELLLSRGAEPDIHAPSLGNKIPLHLAAEYGHPEAAEVLLDFGSNIEARALDHATPLLYAANNGHVEMVSLLLDRGANIRSTNAYNKNAMDLAEKFPNVTHVINRYIRLG